MAKKAKCPLCEEDREFHTKSNLKRHLRINHKLEGDELKEALKDQALVEYECAKCNFKGANISRHLKSEKHKKIVKLSKAPPLTFSDDSSSENDNESEEEVDILSYQEFIQQFEEFCSKSGGSLAPKTIENYRCKIVAFYKFTKKRHREFQLGSLVNVTSREHFTKLPSGTDFITSFEGDRSKTQAANAYKKLVDFICYKLSASEHLMKEKIVTQRHNYLIRRRDEAGRLDTQYSKHIDMKAAQKKREEKHMAKSDSERKISPKELKQLCDQYRNSEYRQKTYTNLQTKMKEMLKKNIMTACDIRNFIMWEMFFEAGGLRPEVVLKMTLMNFAQYETPELENSESDSDDEEYRTIVVHRHKTSESGPARVHLPKATYQIAQKYRDIVRPRFVRDPEENPENALLFLTEGGKQIQSFTDMANLFRKATNCKYKFESYDIRRLIATLGQKSKDQNINTKLPGHMNHQPGTARKYYMAEEEKMNEHLNMKNKVFGKSKNLPVDEEDHESSEEEQLVQMNKTIKRKREEEALEQRKKNFTRNPHKKFNPDEVEIIKQAFAFAVKEDGKPVSNITHDHVRHACNTDEDFNKMFNDHIEERDIAPEDLAQEVINSYRWHCVRKPQKQRNQNEDVE